LKNSFKFQINQEIIDERDNFIILDINIKESIMTLVAIYGPNEDNPEFFKRLLFNLNQGPCSRKYPKICLRAIFRMILGHVLGVISKLS
jgi:hypothetical protein